MCSVSSFRTTNGKSKSILLLFSLKAFEIRDSTYKILKKTHINMDTVFPELFSLKHCRIEYWYDSTYALRLCVVLPSNMNNISFDRYHFLHFILYSVVQISGPLSFGPTKSINVGFGRKVWLHDQILSPAFSPSFTDTIRFLDFLEHDANKSQFHRRVLRVSEPPCI